MAGNVNMRCLRQRAVSHTIAAAAERKKVIPNVKRKQEKTAFFLTGEDHGYYVGNRKLTRRYLQDSAVLQCEVVAKRRL